MSKKWRKGAKAEENCWGVESEGKAKKRCAADCMSASSEILVW